MSFLTYRDINFTINGQNLFCDSLSLNQEANLERPIREGELTTLRNQAAAPKRNTLNLNYYLTGKCPLKNYIFTNWKYPISGRINSNLQFNFGYLESYKLSARPHQPIQINAQILIVDEVSGSLANVTPSSPPNNLFVFNYNDSYFSNDDLNITEFNWLFKNEIEPIYYQKETGLNHINPDRIFIGQKEISADFASDSQNLILGFTGTPFDIVFTCKHPSLNITEDYGISGFINSKNFSVSNNDLHQSNYFVTQNHLNEEPKIGGLDTSTYPSQNYIIIQSLNLVNGFFSSNNLPLVEKVTLGDRNLEFRVSRGPSYDTITGFIPNDAINGTLSIITTKGLIVYPTQVNLNFSGINISGFWPETGNYHDSVLVSGENFHRITQVLINNTSSNFNVFDTTGLYHKMLVSIPDNVRLGRIQAVSSLRNVSGSSTGIFYPIPEITSFTPTGTWSGICIISGHNFSGISNVYFNGVRSPNFTINNNSRITATIPGTGAGYTKGYITVSGHNGMSNKSHSIYHPQVWISGISTISGGIANDIKLTGLFDTGFLCPVGDGGFKIAYGNTTGVVYSKSSYLLSGILPTGFYDNAYISLFEPDGINKYTPFTGKFMQIGPAPIIELINGSTSFTTPLYSSNILTLNGKYFKDFFGLPYYILISGAGYRYQYSDITYNELGTQLQIPNVKITGGTGLHDIYVINYAGSGKMTAFSGTSTIPKSGLFITSGVDKAKSMGSAIHFPTVYDSPALSNVVLKTTSDVDNISVERPAAHMNDGNNSTFSCTSVFPRPAGLTAYQDVSSSGYAIITFNAPINLSYITVKQSTPVPDDGYQKLHVFTPVWRGGMLLYTPPGAGQVLLAESGLFFAFDNSDNIVYRTGISFSNETHILTGTLPNIRRIKFSRNGPPSRYIAFSSIEVY